MFLVFMCVYSVQMDVGVYVQLYVLRLKFDVECLSPLVSTVFMEMESLGKPNIYQFNWV